MRIDPVVLSRFAIPHAHPHALSRRTLLKATAATTAVVAASSVFAPLRAAAAAPGPGTPRPVAPNPDLFGLRVYEVAVGSEPSSITDFNGMVGAALVSGPGTGTDTATGATETLTADVDMRFMQGTFRGTDGRVHEGTFTLI
jgi:hypothetical protein